MSILANTLTAGGDWYTFTALSAFTWASRKPYGFVAGARGYVKRNASDANWFQVVVKCDGLIRGLYIKLPDMAATVQIDGVASVKATPEAYWRQYWQHYKP